MMMLNHIIIIIIIITIIIIIIIIRNYTIIAIITSALSLFISSSLDLQRVARQITMKIAEAAQSSRPRSTRQPAPPSPFFMHHYHTTATVHRTEVLSDCPLNFDISCSGTLSVLVGWQCKLGLRSTMAIAFLCHFIHHKSVFAVTFVIALFGFCFLSFFGVHFWRPCSHEYGQALIS